MFIIFGSGCWLIGRSLRPDDMQFMAWVRHLVRTGNPPSEASELAERTADAYSAERFPNGEWESAAQMLLDRGLSVREAEAVLRSKWTRWCRDIYSKNGDGTADMLRRFLDDPTHGCTRAEIAKLMVR